MKPKAVTNKWVKETFNLDKERQDSTNLVYSEELMDLLEIEMVSGQDLPAKQFAKMLSEILMDVDVVRYEEGYNGATIELLKNVTSPETDQEVIERLKRMERQKRKDDEAVQDEYLEYKRLKAKFEPQMTLSELECSQCRMGKNFTGFCTMPHPEGECSSYVGKQED